MNRLLLIDGLSILNRAFYAMPKFTDHSGKPTGALLGFVNILQKAVQEEKPTHIAVALDERSPTFRHKLFDGYKQTRSPMPDDLRQQVTGLKWLLSAMRLNTLSIAGFEADDIIGSLSKRFGKDSEIIILSGDRDLLQLVDEHIFVKLPKTVKGQSIVEFYDKNAVIEKYELNPVQIIDLKALMGDASDNIKGVNGVGEKTATKLIKEYNSIENLYENIENVSPPRIKNLLLEDKEMAFLSKKLATIKSDIDFDITLDSLLYFNYLKDISCYRYFEELGFKKQLEKFSIDGNIVKKNEKYEINEDFSEIKIEDIFIVFESLNKEISIYPIINNYEIEGIIFGDERTSFVLDFTMTDISKDQIIDVFKIFYESFDKIIVFNYKSIIKTIRFYKFSAEKIIDLTLMAYIIDSNNSEKLLDDSFVLSFLLDTDVADIKSLFNRQSIDEILSDYIEKPKYFAYIAGIQKLMNIAGKTALERLKKDSLNTLYEKIELPLSVVLADMENTGIRTDSQILKKLSSDFSENIDNLQKRIYEQAGEEFNINSPKQMGAILFEKLKLPYGKKTKTGYSTSAEVLEKLKKDYIIIEDILKYRHYTKLKSTYADALQGYIMKDGRIHTSFNQIIASTGRLSSTEPNLQNIPTRDDVGKLIRSAFVPDKDCVFIDADYSQIELRVLAHLSKDEKLIEAYRNGADIHKMTASAVFNVPFDEVTDKLRSNAKAVNFGIVYGISAFGLSTDIDISQKEAKEFILEYFKTFPSIKNFIDKLVDFAKKTGYAKTLFGRKRFIPELKSSNFNISSFGERIAMNTPIQGTAADIIKLAMIRVYNRLKDENMKTKIILQIHDELLLEAPLSECKKAEEILKEEMEKAVSLSVPLSVSLSKGYSLLEVK